MHLRPHQLRDLHEIAEKHGYQFEQFEAAAPSEVLPAPLCKGQLAQGFAVREPGGEGFFVFGLPWHYLRAPEGSERFGSPSSAGEWMHITQVFALWCQEIRARAGEPNLWPETNEPANALGLLSVKQMNEVYRVFETSGLPSDIWKWEGKSSRAVLIASSYGFNFSFQRGLEHGWPRGGYSGSFMPGEQIISGQYENVSWEVALRHFQAWLAAVKVDLPAARYLREPRKPPESPPHATVLSLTLENARMFDQFHLDLAPSPSLKLLLGENGTGKSTILRCLALACCPQNLAQELLNKHTARLARSGELTTIKLGWNDGKGSEHYKLLRIRLDGENQVIDSQEGTDFPGLKVAYGSGRASQGRTEANYSSVHSLFDYAVPLVSPELAVRRLYDKEGEPGFRGRLDSFKRALDLPADVEIPKPEGSLVEIVLNGKAIPLDSWADGFRLTFAWYLDLFDWAQQSHRLGPQGPEGILLIDEVEQHLHPSLQSTFLPNLMKALPAMQIVATTHSPLVTMGVEPVNVLVLDKETARAHPAPDYRAVSVEEVIQSPELFGTDPFAPQTREKVDRQQKLLAVEVRSPDQQMELEQLNQELWSLLPTDPAL